MTYSSLFTVGSVKPFKGFTETISFEFLYNSLTPQALNALAAHARLNAMMLPSPSAAR